MSEYLSLKKSSCKHCYKCIRHCPVKAISFSSDHAKIVSDECILCGECFLTCPQNAKSIRSDLDRAKRLISGGAPVYASIAPSFVANYEGRTIDSLREALRRLGFCDAEETALGATVVKKRYDEIVSRQEQDVLISSCCHSVNMLIQKYFPDALPSLAKVVSPMQAHCAGIKRRHPDAKTIFIGPCISKKAEAEQYPGSVDCVLTFEELSQWLGENDIVPEVRKDRDPGGKTRLFPIPGGILRSMAADNPDYSYIAVDGVKNCVAALQDVVDGNISKCFIEMSACSGGCVGGPAMEKNRVFPVKNHIAVDKSAGNEDFEVEIPAPDKLSKQFVYHPIDAVLPDGDAIENTLRMMGKTKPEHELNCGSCGYETCREKAAAVLAGKAELTMCLPYLKERAESFSNHIISNTPNGIVVLNDTLEIQQVNASACRLLNLKDEHDVLGRSVSCILDPSPMREVLQDGINVYEMKEYLAEQEKFVMMTVIYDKAYDIVIIIMRDVTEFETRKLRRDEILDKTVAIADKVIAKQMRSVQEIASLLGETAAETQVALSKLKETLHDH